MDEDYQNEDDLSTFRGMVYGALAGAVIWAILAATIYCLVMMD